jgi:hypothetical protein
MATRLQSRSSCRAAPAASATTIEGTKRGIRRDTDDPANAGASRRESRIVLIGGRDGKLVQCLVAAGGLHFHHELEL